MVDNKKQMELVEKSIGTNKLTDLTKDFDYSIMVWDNPTLIIDSINIYEEKLKKAKKRNIVRKVLIGTCILGILTTLGLAVREEIELFPAAIVGALCALFGLYLGQNLFDETAENFEIKSYIKTAIDYIVNYYAELKDKINSQNNNSKVKKLNNNINK